MLLLSTDIVVYSRVGGRGVEKIKRFKQTFRVTRPSSVFQILIFPKIRQISLRTFPKVLRGRCRGLLGESGTHKAFSQ